MWPETGFSMIINYFFIISVFSGKFLTENKIYWPEITFCHRNIIHHCKALVHMVWPNYEMVSNTL